MSASEKEPMVERDRLTGRREVDPASFLKKDDSPFEDIMREWMLHVWEADTGYEQVCNDVTGYCEDCFREKVHGVPAKRIRVVAVPAAAKPVRMHRYRAEIAERHGLEIRWMGCRENPCGACDDYEHATFIRVEEEGK